MAGVLGVFHEVDAAVEAIEDVKRQRIGDIQVFMPTLNHEIEEAVGGPESPVRRFTLIVYRRRGRQWLKPREIEFGQTYTTPLLPAFQLVVDPRR